MRRLRRLVAKRRERQQEGVVVAAGVKVIAAALDAGAELEAIYATPHAEQAPESRALIQRAGSIGVPRFELAERVLSQVADAQSPQPILATVRVAPRSIDDALLAHMVLVLVDVRDPGNLGAIVRVGDATGVGAVVCCAGCVDWRSPKAVRASAGSCFSVPLVDGGNPDEALTALRAAGFSSFGTAAKGGAAHTKVVYPDKTAVVLGNEAAGLGSDVAACVDAVVTIPMFGSTESLNVAAAAAVICYEYALQQTRVQGDALR